MVPFKKSKTVPFASSIIKRKNITVFPSWSRLPVKLICCVAFESISRIQL